MATELPRERDDTIYSCYEVDPLYCWAFYPPDASYERRFTTEAKAREFAEMWAHTRPGIKKVVEKKTRAKPMPRYENTLAEPQE